MKNPETNTPALNFLFIRDAAPPKTESSAATIAIARNFDAVYGIVGNAIPTTTPNTIPNIIIIVVIILLPHSYSLCYMLSHIF